MKVINNQAKISKCKFNLFNHKYVEWNCRDTDLEPTIKVRRGERVK